MTSKPVTILKRVMIPKITLITIKRIFLVFLLRFFKINAMLFSSVLANGLGYDYLDNAGRFS